MSQIYNNRDGQDNNYLKKKVNDWLSKLQKMHGSMDQPIWDLKLEYGNRKISDSHVIN